MAGRLLVAHLENPLQLSLAGAQKHVVAVRVTDVAMSLVATAAGVVAAEILDMSLAPIVETSAAADVTDVAMSLAAIAAGLV